MPNPRGFIVQRIELQFEYRPHEILRVVQEQSNRARVPCVQREVPSLLAFQPYRAWRAESSFVIPRLYGANAGRSAHVTVGGFGFDSRDLLQRRLR